MTTLKTEEFRNIRASVTNIEFLKSISTKGETYDRILTKLISIAKPILLKHGGFRD